MYAATLLVALAATTGPFVPDVPPPGDPSIDRPAVVPWTIVQAESVLAVVTQKGGFAGRLAHNHLVVAREYTASLDFDPERPERTTFAFEVATTDLLVDDPAERAAREPRIVELGLVESLGSPDEGDRRKIREEMLDEDQLDAEEHPTIRARLLAVREVPDSIGSTEFPYQADVEVEIRGIVIERAVPVRWSMEGGRLEIEAVGEFTFREFGIEPYSAFLGSVKNQDEFYIYLHVIAER